MAQQDPPSTITLSDGRLLAYQVFSNLDMPATAPTVLYFHGFPGSHPEGGLVNLQTTSHKLRVIALSRPGYAESSFKPDRAFLDWPKDVLEFVNQLEIRQFYVIGLSGGCAYVLACLKAIARDRLLRAAIVSGAFPFCMTSKETLAMNRTMAWISTSTWCSGLLPPILDWFVGRSARDHEHAAEFEKWFVQVVGSRHPKEAQCFQDVGARKAAVESCKLVFQHGSRGMAWEARMLNSDWNIPSEDIDGARLDVWYGRQDKNLSADKAVEVASYWIGCKLHVLEDESHLSLMVNYSDEIVDHLLVGA